MKKIISLCVLYCLVASPVTAIAASKLDEAVATARIAKCMLSNTQTMCLIEALNKLQEWEKVPAEQPTLSNSGNYFLATSKNNWKRQTSNTENTDLLLINNAENAMIEATWHVGSEIDVEKIARDSIAELATKLDVTLENIEFDVWPFNDGGYFYEVCYETIHETEECMFSTAAPVMDGAVSMFALLNADDALVEEVLELILSIDVPKDIADKYNQQYEAAE